MNCQSLVQLQNTLQKRTINNKEVHVDRDRLKIMDDLWVEVEVFEEDGISMVSFSQEIDNFCYWAKAYQDALEAKTGPQA